MPLLLWEAWQEGPCILNFSRISALTRSSAADPPPCHWLLTLLIVSHMASCSHNGRRSVSGLLYWLYPVLSAPTLRLIILMASSCLFLTVKSRSSVLLWMCFTLRYHCPVPLIEDIQYIPSSNTMSHLTLLVAGPKPLWTHLCSLFCSQDNSSQRNNTELSHVGFYFVLNWVSTSSLVTLHYQRPST